MTKQPVVPGTFDIEDGNLTLAVGNVPFETLPFKSVGLIIEEKTYREEMAAKQTAFQPAFNNSDAYFASASATLARRVFKRLSLMVTTMDNSSTTQPLASRRIATSSAPGPATPCARRPRSG